MAASTSGAVKATIETFGLGLAAYRDGAPTKVNADGSRTVVVPYPHAVVQEGVGSAPERHGDTDAPDRHDGTTELVQVDLLQLARDATGAVLEDYALADRLADALNGCTRELQQHAPWRVYGCRVQSVLRAGPRDNVVRHILTLAIRRDTRRTP